MPIPITDATVTTERDRLLKNSAEISTRINDIRDHLGAVFGESVDPVSSQAVADEISTVFADPDLAVNVTGYLRLLDEIDIASDYHGFIVDEMLGRHLAMTIAEGEPEATLAAATFHLVDASLDLPAATAGVDDRAAAIVAGFQVRLPGWDWQEHRDPFGSDY